MSDQQNPGTEIPDEALNAAAEAYEEGVQPGDEYFGDRSEIRYMAEKVLRAALPSLTAGLSRELEELRAETSGLRISRAEQADDAEKERRTRLAAVDRARENQERAEAAEQKLEEARGQGPFLVGFTYVADRFRRPAELFAESHGGGWGAVSEKFLATLDYEQPTDERPSVSKEALDWAAANIPREPTDEGGGSGAGLEAVARLLDHEREAAMTREEKFKSTHPELPEYAASEGGAAQAFAEAASIVRAAASTSTPSEPEEAKGHDFELPPCTTCGSPGGIRLDLNEVTAIVSAAFSEDHDAPTFDAAIKRLGDWADSQLGAIPSEPEEGK